MSRIPEPTLLPDNQPWPPRISDPVNDSSGRATHTIKGIYQSQGFSATMQYFLAWRKTHEFSVDICNGMADIHIQEGKYTEALFFVKKLQELAPSGQQIITLTKRIADAGTLSKADLVICQKILQQYVQRRDDLDKHDIQVKQAAALLRRVKEKIRVASE